MRGKRSASDIHLHLKSPQCSPASWMLLFDVESAIILKVATKKLNSKEGNNASSVFKALVWRKKKTYKQRNTTVLTVNIDQPGQQLQS